MGQPRKFTKNRWTERQSVGQCRHTGHEKWLRVEPTNSPPMKAGYAAGITISDDLPTDDCDTESSGNVLGDEVSIGDYSTKDLMM